MMADKDMCPKCKMAGTKTVDSRSCAEVDILRVRKKKCEHCGLRFETYEVIADENGLHLRANNIAAVRSFMRGVEDLARREFGNDKGHLKIKIVDRDYQ